MRNWLLPENIEDMLPEEARRIEHIRAILLEHFRLNGYRLVIPPMIEYLESLLTGTGEDLDLGTFKLVDQMSGRMMGLRADITPQVARIDAHLLNSQGITRLCYCGTVVHARPRGLNATREPLQLGAEIYGHAGIESDLEIQGLLRQSLRNIGLSDIRIDLGHVGIFREICHRGSIGDSRELRVHEMLASKDLPRLTAETADLDQATRDALTALPSLYGGREVIANARRQLPDYPRIVQALDDLESLVNEISGEVSIDLADLRGYRYHSGVIFAGYLAGRANAIALGGRYDEVGRSFGRARAATGFSLDLRSIASVAAVPDQPAGILAPWNNDAELLLEIDKLRGNGEVVIIDLPGHGTHLHELGCDRELVLENGQWRIRPIR